MNSGGRGTLLQGNFIGTNVSGTAKIPNAFGVVINGSANNTIGGTTAEARNIISGNVTTGVRIINAGATNNVVQGNFIGTDVTGTKALANGEGANGDGTAGYGIEVGQIGTGPSNITIGGTVPGAGNLISGNSYVGVSLFGNLSGINLQGNLIGTDVTGRIALHTHFIGILVGATSPGTVTIGGTSVSARNIISGNETGISLGGLSTGLTVQGNYIGTDITGNVALANTFGGIVLGTNDATIGGTTPGAGNVISGNDRFGIQFGDPSLIGTTFKGNLIQGNFIGTKADGVSALGNRGYGIDLLDGASNSIGGTTAGAANAIAFNTQAGVTGGETGNAILGNSIFSNGGLGIDLGGLIANDNCDVDKGSNNKQNFPEVTSANANSTTTTIQGTLNSGANTQFRIEFFANSTCDPSGYGEGRTFLGFTNATTDASCNASFNFSVPNALVTGSIITATATDPSNNTSEFSACASLADLSATMQFNASSYTVGEGDKRVDVTITRTANSNVAASVSFATSDLAGLQNCNIVNGVASSRCDYEARFATVRFAPGETSKNVSIFMIDDSYLEGPETFTVNLSNAVGASLGTPSMATVTVTDNDLANGPNPADAPGFFVRAHYLDFLNREPDQSGLDFWTNQIISCGNDQACIQLKRINVSAAFYLSIEFQQTGYLVERIYKTAFGDATGVSTFGGTHVLTVPAVRLNEFLLDTQQIGEGIIVGQTGWETVLENNKRAFTLDLAQRPSFVSRFPTSITPQQFVNQLFANDGVTPSNADRNAAIAEFGGALNTSDVSARARALRDVAENSILNNQEFNRAFVLMQYFGYLRRNPNDNPDSDYTGYDFWLTKLNQFNSDFQKAEMVEAFVNSAEYRSRFGSREAKCGEAAHRRVSCLCLIFALTQSTSKQRAFFCLFVSR